MYVFDTRIMYVFAYIGMWRDTTFVCLFICDLKCVFGLRSLTGGANAPAVYDREAPRDN